MIITVTHCEIKKKETGGIKVAHNKATINRLLRAIDTLFLILREYYFLTTEYQIINTADLI